MHSPGLSGVSQEHPYHLSALGSSTGGIFGLCFPCLHAQLSAICLKTNLDPDSSKMPSFVSNPKMFFSAPLEDLQILLQSPLEKEKKLPTKKLLTVLERLIPP